MQIQAQFATHKCFVFDLFVAVVVKKTFTVGWQNNGVTIQAFQLFNLVY